MKGITHTLSIVLLTSLLAACSDFAPTSDASPAWACPSPTAQPYGATGPIKAEYDCDCKRDPLSGNESCDTCYEYFQIWEQEYPAGGPPFPSPTPFVVKGSSYLFGQRVLVPPLYATVNADLVHKLTPDTALYSVTITWNNPLAVTLPVDYYGQVRLRSIKTADGRILSDGEWRISDQSLTRAGMSRLPVEIPAGESTILLPIIAPYGMPHTVEVGFLRDPAAIAALPTAAATLDTEPTVLSAAPAASPLPAATITATPANTANNQLRNQDHELVAITWTAAQAAQPDCLYGPGAMTVVDISGGHGIADQPLAAPAGASRVVQIAMAQVGKPYVFGAQGPHSFDCSGLCYWSYGQIGMRIPRGTAGQWPEMQPVTAAQAQPGDLVFFVFGRLGGRVDHVGMVVGDADGDGTVDMVHAANPALGVRMEYNFLAPGSTYAHRLAGFRTVR